MLGDLALGKLLRDYEFETVLDIGSGAGAQAQWMRRKGRQVITIDPAAPSNVRGFYPCMQPPREAIWCCHVLEHQRDPGAFLDATWHDLEPAGILAITVPPFRAVVPGHVTAWNAGLLLYNLVLAGFDCSRAAVRTYGHNISVIVRKGERPTANERDKLIDIARYFPVPLTGERPRLGVVPTDISEVNW